MEDKIIKPYSEADIERHAGKVGGKRNLREIIITTDDGYEFHFLVKKPGRSVIAAIADYEKKKDVNAQQKVMLGCMLEGDKDVIEYDGAVYTKLLEKISRLMETAKAEIKKL